MYQVEFRPRAARDSEKLDQVVADRLLNKLRWLAENFDSVKTRTRHWAPAALGSKPVRRLPGEPLMVQY